jgi:hypothetical protein
MVIVEPEGAGIYFANTIAFLDGVWVAGADTGGVVGVSSSSFILNSSFTGNTKAGIQLVDGFSKIENNVIVGTHAQDLGAEDVLGDGITLWSLDNLMHAQLFDNLILGSDRAGVSAFGALVEMADNDIFCSAFDLGIEDFGSFAGEYVDLNGNECGCGLTEPCLAKSYELKPPPPVGGLE